VPPADLHVRLERGVSTGGTVTDKKGGSLCGVRLNVFLAFVAVRTDRPVNEF
jgi:hypothetical protein